MKTVIAIACILSAVFVQADIIDIYLQSCTDLFMACAKENGYTEQDPREIYDKDNNLGVDGCTCLRTCTMKALGMLNGLNLELGGMYAFINAVHAGNPEKINFLQNVVVDCKDQVKSMTDECKLGFSFTDCFLSKH